MAQHRDCKSNEEGVMDPLLKIFAETIKKDVSDILHAAISGFDKRYRYKGGYIRWGLVEKDIYRAIDKTLME